MFDLPEGGEEENDGVESSRSRSVDNQLHFQQAKIMLIRLKIAGEAARRREWLSRPSEQRLDTAGHSWFACSKATISE